MLGSDKDYLEMKNGEWLAFMELILHRECQPLEHGPLNRDWTNKGMDLWTANAKASW